IFDKTGTLTEGRFGVVAMATAHGWTEDAVLALAAAVEGDSEHPIAQGIRRLADERGLSPDAVTDFEAIKGRGIRARHQERDVYVGGPQLLAMLDARLPDALARFRDEASAKGQAVVYLIDERSPVAAFTLADVIRPESRQ